MGGLIRLSPAGHSMPVDTLRMQVLCSQFYRFLLPPSDIEIGIVIPQAVLHDDQSVTAFPQMTAGAPRLTNQLPVDQNITALHVRLHAHIRVDRLQGNLHRLSPFVRQFHGVLFLLVERSLCPPAVFADRQVHLFPSPMNGRHGAVNGQDGILWLYVKDHPLLLQFIFLIRTESLQGRRIMLLPAQSFFLRHLPGQLAIVSMLHHDEGGLVRCLEGQYPLPFFRCDLLLAVGQKRETFLTGLQVEDRLRLAGHHVSHVQRPLPEFLQFYDMHLLGTYSEEGGRRKEEGEK